MSAEKLNGKPRLFVGMEEVDRQDGERKEI